MSPAFPARRWFQSTHSLWSATLRFGYDNRHPWFQSTHSLWSATDFPIFNGGRGPVSIHALLVECDDYYLRAVGDVIEVSIHALLVECDA